jgi:CubicO group peptidase (beta-lactamase class C family)
MADTVLKTILDDLATALAAYVPAGEASPMLAAVHRDGEDEDAIDWTALPLAIIRDDEEVDSSLTGASGGVVTKHRSVEIEVFFGSPPAGGDFDSISDYRVWLQAWIGSACRADPSRSGHALDTTNLRTSAMYTDAEGPGMGRPYFVHEILIRYRHREGDPTTEA